MALWLVLFLLILQRVDVSIAQSFSGRLDSDESPLAIVFVYSVVPGYCAKGLPRYVQESIKHTAKFQHQNPVVLVSNFYQCFRLIDDIGSIVQLKFAVQQFVATAKNGSVPVEPSGLPATLTEDASLISLVDLHQISSANTQQFWNQSQTMFMRDGANDLWLTSAMRFFHLEDAMNHLSLSDALHVEADNLLFGDFSARSQTVRSLREHYAMALTPLVANQHIVTASVFYIRKISLLHHLNEFLLELAAHHALHGDGNEVSDHPVETPWTEYMRYLSRYEYSKRLGRVKPFAINEMTMLAYYHVLHPHVLQFLPVLPFYRGYVLRRPFCDFRHFMPTGTHVGPGTFLSLMFYPNNSILLTAKNALEFIPQLPTDEASALRGAANESSVSVFSIFDPGSYGQSLGGTHKNRGSDVGFVDSAHIVGQARLVSHCLPAMLCMNVTREVRNDSAGHRQCFTAPFVKCGIDTQWTPILNLHVHSKNVDAFLSKPCPC